MVIYRALATVVAGNNNFHENYDRRRFLSPSLVDTRPSFLSVFPLTTSFLHSRLLNLRGALCAAQKLIKRSRAKHANQASHFGPDTKVGNAAVLC